MSLPPWGGTHSWTTETATETLLDRIETNTDHLKRRLDTIEQLIDSATAAQGQLLVTNGAATVARTSSRGQAGPIGVALASMTPSGIVQYVRWAGIAEVMIASAVAIGDRLRPSATVGRAETCPNGSPGAFAVARTAGATTGDIIEVVLTPGGRQNWRYAAAVAAAATFTVPTDGELVAVTGTTTITSFVGGGQERAVILDAVDGFTIDAAALANTSLDVVLAADQSVLLFTNGTGWFLVGAPPLPPGSAAGIDRLWDPYTAKVVPTAANFATHDHWIGGASLTDYADRVEFLCLGTVASQQQASLRAWANGTNQVFTVALRPRFPGQGNYEFGILLRDSATDKRQCFQVFHDAGRWTTNLLNQTTYNTFGATTGPLYLPPNWTALWFQVERGASRKFRYGWDPANMIEYSSATNTDYLTPDQVGVYINPNSVAQTGILEILSFTHV